MKCEPSKIFQMRTQKKSREGHISERSLEIKTEPAAQEQPTPVLMKKNKHAIYMKPKKESKPELIIISSDSD